ncbi:hypothetical protein AURDEDRAFT_95172 [Auricularia subglabra TFB-10046 SS5]|nr:hypothetical protein AURDEDRAFT_95172 [Auricularia subglabra TFB-10046 SS5]
MIVLPSLRKLLKQSLSPPNVHTAALFTPPGSLISYATQAPASPARPSRPFGKDDVRLLVGLATEVWAEARAQPPAGAGGLGGIGMAECELGRIVVVPVYSARQLDALPPATTASDSPRTERDATPETEPRDGSLGGIEPVMLLAVQGNMDADWDDLLASAHGPAEELAGPLSNYGNDLLRDDAPSIAAK